MNRTWKRSIFKVQALVFGYFYLSYYPTKKPQLFRSTLGFVDLPQDLWINLKIFGSTLRYLDQPQDFWILPTCGFLFQLGPWRFFAETPNLRISAAKTSSKHFQISNRFFSSLMNSNLGACVKIRILKMVDYNPHIAGFCNPVNTLNNQAYLHCSIVLVRV